MPGPVRFYDSDRFVISLAGIRIQGFADGEFLTIKPTQPAFNRTVGVDGEVARGRNADKTVEIVVKLLQTSASNLALSALFTLDNNSPNGAGVGAFLAQDVSGNTIVSAPQAWIISFPDQSWDRAPKSREWTIHTGAVQWIEGGN